MILLEGVGGQAPDAGTRAPPGVLQSKMADMTLLSGHSSVETSETPLANLEASGRDRVKDVGYSKSRGREILGQS